MLLACREDSVNCEFATDKSRIFLTIAWISEAGRKFQKYSCRGLSFDLLLDDMIRSMWIGEALEYYGVRIKLLTFFRDYRSGVEYHTIIVGFSLRLFEMLFLPGVEQRKHNSSKA